ncbi:uncharacterized protein LOC116142188 [Pistacia vera]|uniref:uncharacterized protein LOC116142188 n=1 Tax=Pistacia vera TaxID=55513 RepID=UPI00126351E3|nr:uncharacterized protein LOC116142188 [Pistacia vera]
MLSSGSLSLTVGGVPISTQYGASVRSPSLSFPTVSQTHFKKCSTRNSSSFKTAVASIESNQLSSSSNPPPEKEEANKYYFVVANAKFMLDEEEHFKELMFERRRNYGERDKEQDFWLVIEPKFLDKFPNITKRLRRPAVALVSTNGPWITFMKLRLDRVLSDVYEADSLDEALASNPATLEFEKPEKWVAPYPKYEYGWWEPFLPTGSKESKV